jgi:hypothetical protein
MQTLVDLFRSEPLRLVEGEVADTPQAEEALKMLEAWTISRSKQV